VADFVKRNPSAPPGFFAVEAAGLRWLAVDGGVRCARVVLCEETSLTLERLDSVTPSMAAARDFGARLATTHDAGAASFGAGPNGWTGPGYFGPMSQPLPMSLTGHVSWGELRCRRIRDRVGLHQLYPLLAHAVLFGGSYAGQAEAAAADAVQAVS
jgi:fructosamine-3-kinase